MAQTTILAADDSSPHGWLVGGGEMGKVVRALDWSRTPLGPIESWPQSLRTTVGLCLASNFPISLAWGPRHAQIYNDGYWPICGGKHPHSMGQDFSECWASAWPVIGPAFERALAGETSYLENQRMFLDRNGYLEETFFTFSFSPIRDETGRVGGLFHPVTETTAKMLGERRTRALRDLSARAGKAQTTEEAFALAAQTLSESNLDVPFALFYRLDAKQERACLDAQTGAVPQSIAATEVSLQAQSAWPLREVASSNDTLQVDQLSERFGDFSCGPYPEPPKTALLIPIMPPGCERPTAILVAGVSSRLPLTEEYRAFYDLVAAAITSATANACAYEEERRRAAALAEIDRAKTAFFSNVSHEFRTPLTLMLGPLEDELAETDAPLPEDRRSRLQAAHRNTLRLLKLVNSLLDFSRIEAGRIHAHYEASDLAVHTAELTSVFRSAVESGGLTLTLDCPPLPDLVYVDRDMWEKIVLNLLSNAFKHTFRGGIHVTLRWRGDHVELAVADSGVGIPEAEVPHLFDRFHRVKGAKSRTHEGTGIGLALVQELVHAHGGNVQVHSREGEGSTFLVTVKTGRAHLLAERIGARELAGSTEARAAAYVEEALHWISDVSTLPRVSPPTLSAVPESPAVPAPESRDNRARILWADDNADMREYVRRLLAGHYDVTAVSDGAAAVAAALEAPPDLVLTDVMMPGLDGFGVLRSLRAHERTRTIPVILLSARAGEEAAVEGLDAGADDYLVKPFSARELLARVRTHLEMAKVRREWEAELERRVQERTAQLLQTTQDLEAENAERQRAGQKLEAQLARMSLLDQITRAVAQRQDLRSIFGVVVRRVEQDLPADFCCMCLRDPSTNTLTVTSVSYSRDVTFAVDKPMRIDLDRNGLSACLQGQIVYEPDLGGRPAPFYHTLAGCGLQSLVAAPLLVQNQMFGILLAARHRTDAFSGSECEFLRQLSEHIALAARQAELHSALQTAYDDLRLSQETLMQQERLRALGEMASGIAHDINNSISPIAIYTESLLERDAGLSERARNCLVIIQRAIHDVASTVARMREFYRPREVQAELTRVDLNDLVNQVVALTRARWSDLPQRRGVAVELRIDLTTDLPQVISAEGEIRDALTNLIFNAVDAMPEGGTLTLCTRALLAESRNAAFPDQVFVEVSDTGVGMDDDTRRRCIEPFYTTKGEHGTGLGLAMVYGMTQRNGGRLEIESAVGKGTTVRLVFPVATSAPTATSHPSQPHAVRPLRILLIDDDPLLSGSLQDILQGDGHTVTTADGGQKGIDVFLEAQGRTDPFEVVITDLGMAHIDGHRVAASIKTVSSATPVFLLTGWGKRTPAGAAIPNIDHVLSKPPRIADIRAALAGVCAQSQY